MSSRKRKAQTPPKDGSEASRVERKRIQNRISQKCHRERQAAHARHLESVVEFMKPSDEDIDNTDGRYSQYMKVIEEKRELEEAIFRMRKKLLSISNSAAAAADDEAVDALVGSKTRTGRRSKPDSPPPTSSSQNTKPINEEESMMNTKPTVISQTEIESLSNGAVNAQETQLLDLASSNDMSPINWTSASEQQSASVAAVARRFAPQDYSNGYSWTFGAMELTYPLDHSFISPQPTKTITVTSTSIFAKTILDACGKYVDLYSSEAVNDTITFHNLPPYDRPNETRDINHVTQISAVGVHMLAAFAGLELYIYGVGAASFMESVLRWRLMPTLASRSAIPEPFRPTPLQYSTSDHSLIIDFVNWPSIRDQLILHSQNIDMDEVVRAIVQNTVVEIPHRQISVNVLSLFYSSTLNPGNHLAWNDLKTSITDSQWKYLEIPVPSKPDFISSDLDPSPTESALVQEISRRIDAGSNASSPEENIGLNTVDIIGTAHRGSQASTDSLTGSWCTTAHRRNEIVTRFGLDQVSKWKLSKDFARKHPFLDCSSAVTDYDMVSSQVVLEAEMKVC